MDEGRQRHLFRQLPNRKEKVTAFMRWVTRERVKVDRVACPWLIRKYIDPDAEFVFLPHDTDWRHVDGIVFDVPGAELGHQGENVSFDAILDKHKLNDAAFSRCSESPLRPDIQTQRAPRTLHHSNLSERMA